MREASARTRIFVTQELAAGTQLRLSAQVSHHLVTVLRAKPGEPVTLFNGRDGEWSARLVDADRKGAELCVERQRRPQPRESGPCLAFAPVKRAKTDLIVEKVTELGAGRLQPVITARSIAGRVKLARLETIAREAAEQCGRLDVPEIGEPVTLEALLESWPETTRLIFCDESATAPPLLKAALEDGPGPKGLLIGPEGGFSPEERSRLHAHPMVRAVTLGARILRAETAAIAALAILQAATSTAQDDLQC